jgi:hypothetical protein
MKIIIFTGQEQSNWKEFVQQLFKSNPHIKNISTDLTPYFEHNNINPENHERHPNEDNQLISYIHQGENLALNYLSQLKFDYEIISFYSSPENALAHAFQTNPSLEYHLFEQEKLWQQQAEDILNIYLNNNSNCGLYDLQKCKKNPGNFITLIQKKLGPGIELNPFSYTEPEVSYLSNFNLISNTIIRNNPSLEILFEQLESAAEQVIENEITQSQDSILEQCISELQKQLINTTKIDELEKINAKLEDEMTSLKLNLTNSTSINSDLKSQNDLFILQVTQLQDELEKALLISKEQCSQQADLTKKLEYVQQQSQTEKQELLCENELALLQINQLQEELEQYFLNAQRFENQVNELKNSHANAQKQLTDKLSTLETQTAQLQSDNQQLTEENELSLLQINQLQEELEYYYLQYQSGTVWHPLTQVNKALPLHLSHSLTLMYKLEPIT